MNRNTILDQMGIQQWRLRESLSHSTETHSETEVEVKETYSNASAEHDPTLVKDGEIANESAASVSQVVDQSFEQQSLEKVEQKTHVYNWPALIELLNDKQHCHSCAQVNPIIGDGDITADWMFVFDSPTTRDIQLQELLTGRVGQLFDAILLALQLNRESIYLSSIFKCPPAASISKDAALCDSVLQHQIKLVDPKVVIAFGEFTAQALIKANEGLEQLRTQVHNCSNHPVRVVPTYSLMQMLDTPLLKAKVWDDLKAARHLLAS